MVDVANKVGAEATHQGDRCSSAFRALFCLRLKIAAYEAGGFHELGTEEFLVIAAAHLMLDAAEMFSPECLRTDNLASLGRVDEDRCSTCIGSRHVLVQSRTQLLRNPSLSLDIVTFFSGRNAFQHVNENFDRPADILRFVLVFQPRSDFIRRSIVAARAEQRQSPLYRAARPRLAASSSSPSAGP